MIIVFPFLVILLRPKSLSVKTRELQFSELSVVSCRTRQEDVDPDYVFGNFAQLPILRFSAPLTKSFAVVR